MLFKFCVGMIFMDVAFVAANLYLYFADGQHWYSLGAAAVCGLCGLWMIKLASEARAI